MKMKELLHFKVYPDGNIKMPLADESHPMLATDEVLHDYDKTLFVHNLGALLAQTREGVTGCSYRNDREKRLELVTIHYTNGYTREVNVSLDSYTALIRDVTKAI